MLFSKKVLFLFNPRAGTMKIRQNLVRVIELFSENGYLVTSVPTMKKGTQITEELASGYPLMICSGGDGTFNAVLSGIMALPEDVRPVLGYLPSGSTNDFAASLGLSGDVLETGKKILFGQETRLDIGRFNDRYFSYVASFGAFTNTSYETPQEIKNTLGHAAYLLEGIKDLSKIRPCHLRIEANGDVFEDDWLFGCFSNSTSIAGLLKLDKTIVDMSDGLLEVLLIRFPRDLTDIPKILTALQSGTYPKKYMEFFHTSSAMVSGDATVDWSLDGEYAPGNEKISVQNVPKAIRLKL